MWPLIIGNLHPAFQRYAGRKSPAELGMCGADAVPRYCRSCSQDTHGVCEAARQEGKFAVGGETLQQARNRLSHSGWCTGFLLISLCNTSHQLSMSLIKAEMGKKWCFSIFALFPQILGKPHLGRIPTTPWLYLTLAISSTAAACLTMTCWRDRDGKSPSVTCGEAGARYSGR